MSLAGTWYNARADKTIEVREDTPSPTALISHHPFYGRLGTRTFYRFTDGSPVKNWSMVAPSVLQSHLEALKYKRIPDTEVYEDLLWE